MNLQRMPGTCSMYELVGVGKGSLRNVSNAEQLKRVAGNTDSSIKAIVYNTNYTSFFKDFGFKVRLAYIGFTKVNSYKGRCDANVNTYILNV